MKASGRFGDPGSGCVSHSSSPSSSSDESRREVKNSANVAPTLQISVEGGSYERVPKSSSGARYALSMERVRFVNQHESKESTYPVDTSK